MSSEFSNEVFTLRLGREGARSGELQISLIWNDIADLDLHVHAPDDEHIYYGNKQAESGGWLDVDMNVMGPGPNSKNSLEPVENVFWHSSPSGDYKVVVHNFTCHCSPDTVFTDPERYVPFRCVVKRGGKTETFDGKVKRGEPVTAFEFEHVGTGAVGSFVVLPDYDGKTTFAEACERHGVTYSKGQGYYAVARMEKIQGYKKLLLHHIPSDTFTIGRRAVKNKLGWPQDVDLKKTVKDIPEGYVVALAFVVVVVVVVDGVVVVGRREGGREEGGRAVKNKLGWPQDVDLKKTVKDIPEGYRLFVQSTSPNRVIKPGTHVLVKVGMDEALRFRAESLSKKTAELAAKNAEKASASPKKKKAPAKKAPAKKATGNKKRKATGTAAAAAAAAAPAPAPAPKRGRKKKGKAAAAAAFRRFEHGGTKFWQVKLEGKDMVVEYGSIGKAARESRKTLASEEKAEKEMEKMIKQKEKKGYAEV